MAQAITATAMAQNSKMTITQWKAVTVAAVTGMPTGAVYGVGAIPPRWLEPLHVPLPGCGDRVLRLPELTCLATALASNGS